MLFFNCSGKKKTIRDHARTLCVLRLVFLIWDLPMSGTSMHCVLVIVLICLCEWAREHGHSGLCLEVNCNKNFTPHKTPTFKQWSLHAKFASEFRARASGDSSAVCWYWNRNYSPQRMWRIQECDQVHVALRHDLRNKCGIETHEGRRASDCATSTTTKCTRPVSRLRTKQHTALWLSKGSLRNIF